LLCYNNCVKFEWDPRRASTMHWSDEPIDLKLWKRVPGNPFADYDPADGIALWSLWEMPSCVVGKVVRRGRPRGKTPGRVG
jgi:hypothetical protein